MSKGTILYIGGFELPDKNAAAHRVLSNAKVLRELDYEVVFISVDKVLPYNNSFVLDTARMIDGFEVWMVPYPYTVGQWIHYLSSIEAFLDVASAYLNLKAVICYNYPSITMQKIRQYCQRRHIRIMADCTEWYSTKGSGFIYKVLKGLDTLIRMRVIHKKLDGLIVISKYLEQYYNTHDNVIRVPPLVNIIDEKWQLPECENVSGPARLVYAGSPGGKQKDRLDLLIKALSELDANYDFRLIIVGISREKHLQYYREQAKLLDLLGKKVVFLGRLSHLESLEQVKGADFSIFIREDTRANNAGFPTKFVESISCGVPVITNKTSNLSDYLSDGENGFWLEGNMVATLQKILDLDRSDSHAMKPLVVRSTFDYHTYLDKFAAWLEPQAPASPGGGLNADFCQEA